MREFERGGLYGVNGGGELGVVGGLKVGIKGAASAGSFGRIEMVFILSRAILVRRTTPASTTLPAGTIPRLYSPFPHPHPITDIDYHHIQDRHHAIIADSRGCVCLTSRFVSFRTLPPYRLKSPNPSPSSPHARVSSHPRLHTIDAPKSRREPRFAIV